MPHAGDAGGDCSKRISASAILSHRRGIRGSFAVAGDYDASRGGRVYRNPVLEPATFAPVLGSCLVSNVPRCEALYSVDERGGGDRVSSRAGGSQAPRLPDERTLLERVLAHSRDRSDVLTGWNVCDFD